MKSHSASASRTYKSFRPSSVFWTQEKIQELIKLSNRNVPRKEIAKTFGCSKKAIDAQLSRAGQTKPSTTWNAEKVTTLGTLWGEGYSASQIAERLGLKSRNAVIGKLHRLGLTRDASTPRRGRLKEKIKEPPTPASAQSKPAQKGCEQATDVPHVYGLAQLDEIRDCKWPIDHDKGVGFCGCERVPGSSYCEHHHMRSTRNYSAAMEKAKEQYRMGNPVWRALRHRLPSAVTAAEIESEVMG